MLEIMAGNAGYDGWLYCLRWQCWLSVLDMLLGNAPGCASCLCFQDILAIMPGYASRILKLDTLAGYAGSLEMLAMMVQLAILSPLFMLTGYSS
jgi:hypothetical protein